MKRNILLQYLVTLFLFILIASCTNDDYYDKYSGKPFIDEIYTKGIQSIPGKIQCEYYDLGGQGIAFYDIDSTNSGSGTLNPPNGSILNQFRMNEGVDISYTKSNGIDNSPFNTIIPEMNRLYVGWTSPGEWTNYSVDVEKSGKYRVGIMHTSNRGGQISLAINNKDIAPPIDIITTYDEADSIAWRQWHHWNYQNDIAEVELKEGKQVLTLKTVSKGMMKYDYLDFELIK